MKKVKILVASVLFCAMGYTGYTAHEKMSMSEAERFMKTNIEALTRDEPGGGGDFRYPKKDGDAKFCTLYVYTKGSVVIKRTTEDPGLEASGEYTKSTIRGLEDRCPIKDGNGCNPYSCQEVPY